MRLELLCAKDEIFEIFSLRKNKKLNEAICSLNWLLTESNPIVTVKLANNSIIQCELSAIDKCGIFIRSTGLTAYITYSLIDTIDLYKEAV